MYQDLIDRVQKAIDRSVKWAESGWKVSFGSRGVEVCSLKEAENLPKTFVYREEALTYWIDVEQIGREAAEYGMKALEALKRNDLQAAEDALYFAQYIEKPFSLYSSTWQPVHEEIKSKL